MLGFDESGPAPAPLLAKQQHAALRAVELDPNLAIAHVRLAQFYEENGNPAKAKEHMARARALDPDEPFVLADAATRAVDQDDLPTAIALQRGIVARDPLAGVARQNLAVFLLVDGQYEAALSEFRKVQEIHPESDAGISREIAPVLVLLRRFDEAEAEASKLPPGKIRDQAMAPVYVATGRDREADAAIARLVASEEEIFDTIRLAEVYAYRGEADQAFASLDEKMQSLIREHGPDSGHAWYLQHEARLSPFLKALHRIHDGPPSFGQPHPRTTDRNRRPPRRAARVAITGRLALVRHRLRRRQAFQLRIERTQVDHHQRLAVLFGHGAQIAAAALAEDEVRSLLPEAVA